MVLSSVLERATQLLASKDRSSEHDGRNGNNAEKVKFSTFKDAGHAAGHTPIDSILWTWETKFASAGISPKVSRVIGLMAPGGNLSNLKDTFRSVTRDLNDPNDIRNWTWDCFLQRTLQFCYKFVNVFASGQEEASRCFPKREMQRPW
jgi:hypothetical protein